MNKTLISFLVATSLSAPLFAQAVKDPNPVDWKAIEKQVGEYLCKDNKGFYGTIWTSSKSGKVLYICNDGTIKYPIQREV